MINIAICDDDKNFIVNTKKLLEKHINFKYNIFSYESYSKEFINYIKTNKVPTIYILDIDLKNKDVNGLYIARKIRQLRNYYDEIIFLTNHEKYIRNLINNLLNPTAYILKSCYDDKLINAVKAAYNFIIMKNDSYNSDNGEIVICEFKIDYRIKFKDIMYIEKVKANKYVLIKAKPDYFKEEYKVLYNIGALMGMLDERFCWLSRSMIVNKNYIKCIDIKNKNVVLESGESLIGTEDNIIKISNWMMCKKAE